MRFVHSTTASKQFPVSNDDCGQCTWQNATRMYTVSADLSTWWLISAVRSWSLMCMQWLTGAAHMAPSIIATTSDGNISSQYPRTRMLPSETRVFLLLVCTLLFYTAVPVPFHHARYKVQQSSGTFSPNVKFHKFRWKDRLPVWYYCPQYAPQSTCFWPAGNKPGTQVISRNAI